jgi:hypothetical protein
MSQFKIKSVLICLSMMTLNPAGWAQDEEENAAESRAIVVSAIDDGSGEPPQMRILSMSDSDSAPMFFSAGFGDIGFAGGPMADSFGMLSNPSVQKDLQLVDEQVQQIDEINREFGEKIREKLEEGRDDSGKMQFGPGSGIDELFAELREEQQTRINSILLPAQQVRLKQVSRQMHAKHMGTAKAILNGLASDLEITDEQRKKIKVKSTELQRDMEAKIAKLRAEAKEHLLQELTSEQRKKLKELLGDEFVSDESDFEQSPLRRIMPRNRAERDF